MARQGSQLEKQMMLSCRDFCKRYAMHKDTIFDFMKKYTSKDTKHRLHGNLKYMAQLQAVVDRTQSTVWVDLADLEEHANSNGLEDMDLVSSCFAHTHRYLGFFYDACVRAMPEKNSNVLDDAVEEWYKKVAENNPDAEIPPHVKCKFQVRFRPGQVKAKKLRDIRAHDVGSLVTMTGTVTRASAVRPRVEVCTYQCAVCLREQFQVITEENYMPRHQCQSPECEGNKVQGLLHPCLESSKLVRCQDLRLQEAPGEVPTGTVPRMCRVLLLGDLTRQCVPGDRVTLTGVFSPVKRSGFAAMKKGPMVEMQLEAHHIEKEKQGSKGDNKAAIEEVRRESAQHDMYERLSASMAPEIFGHEDVKKALLLMLVGGVNKRMEDGMRLRGDMHLLLMGDPGVAKSQLIKHVCQVAPRAVYTSGKGSSSVGLTAAVVKDPQTGEVTLEGGALVMADNGICCIDEFDKMDESDRTAIHEVMEQQTVSIAKAGITTSLNARASLICAANPAYGRYNLNRSPVQNINLPDSLLSRFDLTWVLIDKVDAEKDYLLAMHVGHVHQYRKAPQMAADGPGGKLFSEEFLRQFCALAREYEPKIDSQLQLSIINSYANLRADEAGQQEDERRSYTTPRTLLSMLRLAQARARVRFSDKVELADFEEATRLMSMSKESTMPEEDGDERRQKDAESQIYNLLRLEAEKKPGAWLSMVDLEKLISLRGFQREQLMNTIEVYAAVDVFEWSAEKDRVRLVDL